MSATPFSAGMLVLLALAACTPQTINTVTPHESSCLEAVAKVTGSDDVGTFDVIPTPEGVTVLVLVDADDTPWVCLAGDDGFVQRVYYPPKG